MEYDYARIDLNKTNYNIMERSEFRVLNEWTFADLNRIYTQYCTHKKFKSVMPIFYEDYKDNQMLGYFHNDQLVAWSMIMLYPSQQSVCAEQFAWNYETPSLRLGIRSLQSECAFYKKQGYNYLYIHGADDYKKDFDGFEILGPVNSH